MLLICDCNKKAFEELYNRYNKRLLYFMYNMLNRDMERAQDLLQDVFLKIIENPQAFDVNRKFYSWIFTVAANHCRTEMRYLYKDHSSITTQNTGSITSDYKFNSLDETIFHGEMIRALNAMEIDHKETFLLRYQEGLSLNEIAEIMNCSLGTVKSRLHYTTKKLSLELKDFKILINDN